jgi:hypothetical protein
VKPLPLSTCRQRNTNKKHLQVKLLANLNSLDLATTKAFNLGIKTFKNVSIDASDIGWCCQNKFVRCLAMLTICTLTGQKSLRL